MTTFVGAPRPLRVWTCIFCPTELPESELTKTPGKPNIRLGFCPSCYGKTTFKVSFSTGEARKADGMTRVMENAAQGTDEAWRMEAQFVAERLARSGRHFTANDITEEVGLPSSRNLVGAFLNALARDGLIRKVGYDAGDRASQHGRIVAVWAGRGRAA